MNTYYLRLSLQTLAWSVVSTIWLNHFVRQQNPFLGLVGSILLLLAVLIQAILLRKRGIVYVSAYLLGVFLCTTILTYADEQIFIPVRRYYGFTS